MEWSREQRYRKIEEAATEELQELKQKVNACPFRQKFHIQPKMGLLNDPNGFSYYNGRYHLFYQWFPLGPVHGLKYWYHISSTDLVNWEEHGLGIVPGDWFDSHGAYSGSGIVHNERLHLLYTGNTRDENWIRHPYQCMAIMDNENKITKLSSPVIDSVPEGYTEHFRDPKVFEKDGKFYCIIGAQTKDLKGTAVYYQSKDLINWTYKNTIKTSLTDFGYMWECPDYFELEDNGVMIFSPQGIERQGDLYANIYQSGYIIGSKIDFEDGKFEHNEFAELDNGFDFYAPQTMEDHKGRRILIGWMGLPDVEYPTDRSGWAHCLTLPRELRIRNNKLIQTPVIELEQLRKNHRALNETLKSEEKSFNGFSGERYELNCLFTEFSGKQLGVKLRVSEGEETVIYYDIENKKMVLDRSKSGEEFAKEWGTERKTYLNCKELKLQIFVDSSSVEVFVNNGEKVFTTRIFPAKESKGIKFFADGESKISADIWDIY
ncbi:MAG: sucrose-6-phosphate hydrolase [Bacillota bacterium]|nr:sucrose-6-phosphate hydrolase [Bacillota bacterium]